MHVYVPRRNHDDETVEKFYEELEKVIDKIPCGRHIIMSDFNANLEGEV